MKGKFLSNLTIDVDTACLNLLSCSTQQINLLLANWAIILINVLKTEHHFHCGETNIWLIQLCSVL